MTTRHCSFDGCIRTTERPALERWTWFGGIDGAFYCPEHAAEMEAMIVSGALDEIDRQITEAIHRPPRSDEPPR